MHFLLIRQNRFLFTNSMNSYRLSLTCCILERQADDSHVCEGTAYVVTDEQHCIAYEEEEWVACLARLAKPAQLEKSSIEVRGHGTKTFNLSISFMGLSVLLLSSLEPFKASWYFFFFRSADLSWSGFKWRNCGQSGRQREGRGSRVIGGKQKWKRRLIPKQALSFEPTGSQRKHSRRRGQFKKRGKPPKKKLEVVSSSNPILVSPRLNYLYDR